MDEHGTDAVAWFVPGVWPRCTCGFAPRNNAELNAHWAERGFRVVDIGGRLTKIPA